MVYLHTAKFLFQGRPDKNKQLETKFEIFLVLTYNKSSEAKIANFHVEVRIYEHIMTFNITMNDA